MDLLVGNIVIVLFEAFVLYGMNIAGKNKIFMFLAFLQLYVLHAFLDPRGMEDLPGYLETYRLFGENSLYQSIFVGYKGVKMEIGWIVMCKLLYIISSNPHFLLYFTSLLIVGIYLKSIQKYSPTCWLSVFIFLCTTFDQSLFVLRQHSAIAVCLLSIPFVIERKVWMFLAIVSIAFSLHQTAIVFYPIYFIYGFDLNKKFWVLFLSIMFIGSYVITAIFTWAFSNLWYSSYENYTGSNLTLFFIQGFSFLLYIYSVKGKFLGISKVEKVFLVMCIVGLFLTFTGQGFSPTNRLSKYFSIADIFLIPFSLAHLKNRVVRCLIIIGIIVCYFAFFMGTNNLLYIKNYKLLY